MRFEGRDDADLLRLGSAVLEIVVPGIIVLGIVVLETAVLGVAVLGPAVLGTAGLETAVLGAAFTVDNSSFLTDFSILRAMSFAGSCAVACVVGILSSAWNSSGLQILQEQFIGSLVSSVASQRR